MPDYAAERRRLQIKRDSAMADKIGIENAVLRGDLLDREIVRSPFMEINRVFTGVFAPSPEKMRSVIGALLGVSETENFDLSKMMTDEVYKSFRRIKKRMTDFLQDWKEDVTDEKLITKEVDKE